MTEQAKYTSSDVARAYAMGIYHAVYTIVTAQQANEDRCVRCGDLTEQTVDWDGSAIPLCGGCE